MRRPFAAPLLAALLAPALATGSQVTTVADVRVFGGQHFFNGTASSVSGNVDAIVTPAVTFNDRWSLVPTYAGQYRGTRDVQELAGGGTLFQDSTRQSLTLKGVYAPSPTWKFKMSAGGAMEWLRETRDESWGNGLFNNRKVSGGLETEWDPSRAAGGRLSYDFYQLAFPNYASLESSQDPTLSRELAGEKVLDSQNHLFTLSGWSPFPGRMRAEWSLYANMRSFADQPLVDQAGQFTSAKRADSTLSLMGSITSRPYSMGESVKVLGETGFSYAVNSSNQNHYDANKAVFLPNYYDYSEWSLRPRLTAALGDAPWVLTAGLGYVSRLYADRPVQDAGGDYLTAKTRVNLVDASLGVSYPYSKNFKVRAAANLAWSGSNMKYEKTFRYNYRIANYMVGFSYEY